MKPSLKQAVRWVISNSRYEASSEHERDLSLMEPKARLFLDHWSINEGWFANTKYQWSPTSRSLYTCKPQIYPDENMFIELDERIWLHFFHNQQSSKTLSMIVNRSPKAVWEKNLITGSFDLAINRDIFRSAKPNKIIMVIKMLLGFWHLFEMFRVIFVCDSDYILYKLSHKSFWNLRSFKFLLVFFLTEMWL